MRTGWRLGAGTAMLALVTLALAGCVRFTSDLAVHQDNTVSGEYVIALATGTGQQAASTDRELAEELWADTGLAAQLPGAVIADYSDEDFTGISVTFADAPLEAFAPTSERWGITREGDEFVVSGKVSAGGTLPTNAEDEPGSSEPSTPDPDVRVTLTFPGPVTASNGTVTGRTVTWIVSSDETELMARASAVHGADRSTTFAFLILGIVAVTAFAYWLAGVVGRSMRREPMRGDGARSGRIEP